MKPIYLDYNATTPIAPEVAGAMLPYLKDVFGNPSSSHFYGLESKAAVDKARVQLAKLISCKADEIVFTSGGSESNNYAIKGYSFAHRNKGKHIITSQVEHPAVIEVCKFMETQGFEVSYLPVDKTGRVSVADVKNEIRSDTILISIMYANNEVGTMQPISEISELAQEHGIVLHSDCAQAVGKVPVNVDHLGVDLLTIAGHKFYGPKGIGALYVRKGLKLQKLIHGAKHEGNARAGTENVLEIVGIGKAAEIAMIDKDKRMLREKKLLAVLTKELSAIADIRFNGNVEYCLPNTLSVSFKKLKANEILNRLEHVAASAGAACHTDSICISATLEAMGVPMEFAMGTIRFSVGRYTSFEDVVFAANAVKKVVSRLRG